MVIITVFVCSLTISAQTQNDCKPKNLLGDNEILTVEANLLLKEPKCYDGQFIRTFGFYRLNLEAPLLFCMDCGNVNPAWFNTSNFFTVAKRCSSKQDFKEITSKKERVLGIVVLGILKTKGGYGAGKAHDIEFSPICFERVDFLTNDRSAPYTSDQKTTKQMRDWYQKMSEIYSNK